MPADYYSQMLPESQIFECQLTVATNARPKRSKYDSEPLPHKNTPA